MDTNGGGQPRENACTAAPPLDDEKPGRGEGLYGLLRQRAGVEPAHHDFGLGVAFSAFGREGKGLETARKLHQRRVLHRPDLLCCSAFRQQRACKALGKHLRQHRLGLGPGALAFASS